MTRNAIQTQLDSNGLIIPLGIQSAIQKAPAIAATSPAATVSSRYKFTSTEELIGHMDGLGYKLVGASQGKSKVPGKENYTTHIVKFQSDSLFVKGSNGEVESRPTIIGVNNHNGSGSFQFDMGLFRLVCKNGLVIKEKDLGGFKERHTKYTFQELRDLIDRKIEGLEDTVKVINKWVSREMTREERFAFAVEAIALRSDRIATPQELQDLLTPIRKQDEGTDLYHTFNVLQEKVTAGMYKLGGKKARMIENPLRDHNMNKGLWELASRYYN